VHAGLLQHGEGHQLVDLGVDGGADRVVVGARDHLCVTGGAAGGCQPVDNFLGDALDDLALLHAGEGLPQVVEAV